MEDATVAVEMRRMADKLDEHLRCIEDFKVFGYCHKTDLIHFVKIRDALRKHANNLDGHAVSHNQ